MAPPSKPPLPPSYKTDGYKKNKLIVSTPKTGIASRLRSSPHAASDTSEVKSATTSCSDVQPPSEKSRSKTSETTSSATSAPSVSAGSAVPETEFPVGPCMLGNHCFAPTHELRKRCPGCNNLIHVLCGRVLEQMEGSKVYGKWCWFPADSVVCLACDPKNSGTNYTIAGNDDFEREEDNDSGTKESTYQDSGDNDSEEQDDDESDGKIEEEKEVMQDNNETGKNITSSPVKCSYRRCGAGLFLNDVWTLLPCANSSCKKKIHRLCFEHFLTIANLPFQVKTDIICCATVRCCSKFKQQSGDHIRWDSDGPNGPNTTPNSQSIILDW
jgi:hypothetical protein